MAAFAALTSLMQIIHDIEHHPYPPVSINKQQVESLTKIVTWLQEFLETDHLPEDSLEMRIADVAYAAEDVIESHIVDMIDLRKSTPTCHRRFCSTACSDGLKPTCRPPDDFGCLMETIEIKLIYYLQKVIEDMELVKKDAMETIVAEAQLQRSVSASAGFSRSSTMVGFDGVTLEILEKLTAEQSNRQVILIVGMGGIGKTTLAKHVYAHPLIQDRFDICAWATISQQYNTKEILCNLLSQANKRSIEDLSNMSEYELRIAIPQCLSKRRFLIVMDDMWSVDSWEEIQQVFPDNGDGSHVVVTTRESQLSSQLGNIYCLKMKFLDEVSSWNLFLKSVFGKESCPLELEEIGKKIVENCRGLPLAIVVVSGLLKKMEHTQECWESIRNNLSSAVNSANEDFCLQTLKTSYNYMPVYLKPCFLYMGVFEEDRAVRVSTLVKLWVSEGFLKPLSDKSLETTAKEYLNELVDRNLILVHELGCTGNIKYCKIHDLLRDLCWREAGKEGFYDVIGQHKFQGLNRQRRVVIPGSTSKEEVHDALQSMPFVRSFICYSKEVIPLPSSRLLRTLKTYDRDRSGSEDYLLDDLFRFVNLRYLAVGVRGKFQFPFPDDQFWNLQTLIVFHSTHVTGKYYWEMPQLRHLQFYKGYLDMHRMFYESAKPMKNLQTLKGVRHWFIDNVSDTIPNIKNLALTSSGLRNDYRPTELASFGWWNQPVELHLLPYSLKKLSFGSNNHHWSVDEAQLKMIGALPLLEKLKLERAEFLGEQWETSEEQFPSLKFLELKLCFLESWITESSPFPRLEQLHLYGLKGLEEIPSEIGRLATLQSIHLEFCSKSVVESAKTIAEEQEELQVGVVLLNTDDNQALQSHATRNFRVELVDL